MHVEIGHKGLSRTPFRLRNTIARSLAAYQQVTAKRLAAIFAGFQGCRQSLSALPLLIGEADLKLYYAPLACSLAPHIILREAGVRFSLERVDTRKKITETGADFLAINPKGYVPVLELDDGEIVTEGIVLQQLIAEMNPQSGLAPPRGTPERRRLDQWLVFLATEVHKVHIPLFWAATPADAKPLFTDKIGQRYDLIEAALGDGRAHLTGSTFTIADAYLFTLANWAERAGIELPKWPHFHGYIVRVAARPAVQAALAAEGV